jgi:hypothetical protein
MFVVNSFFGSVVLTPKVLSVHIEDNRTNLVFQDDVGSFGFIDNHKIIIFIDCHGHFIPCDKLRLSEFA